MFTPHPRSYYRSITNPTHAISELNEIGFRMETECLIDLLLELPLDNSETKALFSTLTDPRSACIILEDAGINNTTASLLEVVCDPSRDLEFYECVFDSKLAVVILQRCGVNSETEVLLIRCDPNIVGHLYKHVRGPKVARAIISKHGMSEITQPLLALSRN
jgi:hypothetical protein